MNCKDVEERFDAYLLGALEATELATVERHIEACPECSFRLGQEGAIVSDLAYAVPQLDVPSRVASRLMAQIGQPAGAEDTGARRRSWSRLIAAFGRPLAAHSGLAVAMVLVVVIVVGGAWFNDRLTTAEQENTALSAELLKTAQSQQVLGDEPEPIEIVPAIAGSLEGSDPVKEQRYRLLNFLADTPGASTNVLVGSEPSANAHGMLIAQRSGNTALLIAFQLPVSPEGKTYRVWLIKGGQAQSAGALTVDSTGYGQAILTLDAPLSSFDAVVITETVKDGLDASAGGLMRGDL